MVPHPTASATALAALLAIALVVDPPAAAAITVDGQLDPQYPPAVVVQTTQTGLSGGGQIPGDNTLADLNYANGSELDAAHAFVSDGTLHLFLSGNLALRLVVNQNRTVGHILDVFVDSGPGGQNQLSAIGTGNPLNGLTFDAGFEADQWFELWGDGNQFSTEWWAGRGDLFTPSGASFAVLGFAAAGGPGTLSGGSNPFGIKATIDNQNTAGVTLGCNASSGVGVTRGIEWEIPLASIGSPEGCFRLAVIVRDDAAGSSVSNQVLGPAPAGTCPLGSAQFVNFAGVAGDQFFTVCDAPVGVPGRASSGGLKLSLAGANPCRGDQLRFAFDLPDARPAGLELFDSAGRAVRSQVVRAPAAGPGMADLSAGRPLSAGLYWARLTQGAAREVRRICIVK